MARLWKLIVDVDPARKVDSAPFEHLVQDVIHAKDEYNALHPEQILCLLPPRQRKLHFLLLTKDDQCDTGDDVRNSLQPFFDLLDHDYGWDRGSDPVSRPLLVIKVCRSLGLSSADYLLTQMQQQDAAFDWEDARRLQAAIAAQLPDMKSSSGGGRREEVLQKALRRLDTMVGWRAFKDEVASLIANRQVISALQANGGAADFFPRLYRFTYLHPGCGLTTAAELLAEILYGLGLILEPQVSAGMIPDIYYIGRKGPLLVLIDENDCSHVVGMVGAMSEPRIWGRGDIFIFSEKVRDPQVVTDVAGSLQNRGHVLRDIHFPDFSVAELIQIQKQCFDRAGMVFGEEAEERLAQQITREQQRGNLSNTRIVRKLCQQLLQGISTGPDAASEGPSLSADGKDGKEPSEPGPPLTASPWQELQNMVGLDSVKDRIREILAGAAMGQRKQAAGLRVDAPCLHMEFVGSPGTGKTTAARIVGKILKSEGLLSQGGFIEASRSDLVGEYIGHTAVKVADLVGRARGSVLFIDEAYALYSESRLDFGAEAMTTLVKQMEDNRHDLVVVLAGYPWEMEQLMDSLPGLRERVPHRIEFPDYSPDELAAIFRLIMGDQYSIDADTWEDIQRFLAAAKLAAGSDFGNGRFVRNVAERLLLKQSVRLFSQGLGNKEQLQVILQEDFANVLADEDMAVLRLEKRQPGIGFRGSLWQ